MNSNYLEGMQCPECGSYGPFQIVCTVLLTVHDDGTESDGGDVDWNHDSYCRCPMCEKAGEVADFEENKA